MDKDISTLLQEIKAKTEWSEPRIASEIGTSQPTVNRILNGQTDCQGSTWRAIESLHKRLFSGPSDLEPTSLIPARPQSVAEAEKKRNGGVRLPVNPERLK
jgi:hypothetical protein